MTIDRPPMKVGSVSMRETIASMKLAVALSSAAATRFPISPACLKERIVQLIGGAVVK